MAEVSFKGYIVVPDTDIKTFEVTPNSSFQTCVVDPDENDIVIHGIYISHKNPVAVLVEIKPNIPSGKELHYKGVFGNNARPLPFTPPLGPFLRGKIQVKAEGAGATETVYVAVQFSKLRS